MALSTRRPAPVPGPMSALPELGIVPGPVCRVFGMRRSGNHAIINWLQRNAPGGGAVFFNNCVPGKNPFRSFAMVEVNGRRRPGRAGDDPASFATQAGDGAAVIFSYEDAMPNETRKRAVSGDIDEAAIGHEIVICRSFLNWSASLVKKLRPNPSYTPARRTAIVLRAVETYGKMLELVLEAEALGLTVIQYDAWHGSPEYREEVLARLGFAARDNGLGEVQSYGNGSSFQTEATRAEELRPESRWEAMRADTEYRIVLWLAARDAAFCAKLEQVFPEDAARLAGLATDAPPGLSEVGA
ncbi:MAG: hypothetical protein RIG84_20670 [Roseovarius sp.]